MQDKIKLTLTRRQLLRAFIVGGIAAGSGVWWKVFNTPDSLPTKNIFKIQLPAIKKNKADFDVFFALSKIITARAALDEAAAQKVYAVIVTEPWSDTHILNCYKKLLSLLDEAALTYPPYTPAVRQQLSNTEKWFISHLLTTWYVGIYYYEAKAPARILYQQALMFENLTLTHPIPFVTAVGYGHWAQPPVNAS